MRHSWNIRIGVVLLSLAAFGLIFNLIPMEEIIGFQMSIDVRGLQRPAVGSFIPSPRNSPAGRPQAAGSASGGIASIRSLLRSRRVRSARLSRR